MGCDFGFRETVILPVDFNPRTHVGCDRDALVHLPSNHISIHAPMWGATVMRWFIFRVIIFQSTHPCGVRRHEIGKTKHHKYFNPRTHVGCDVSLACLIPLSSVFQSTHPCGVRQLLMQFWKQTVFCISIHAPMWGAT